MKLKALLFIVTALFSPLFSWAQAAERYLVKEGEIAVKIIPVQQQYLFPDFSEGLVILNDDQYLETKLNYSLLYDEIHFINKDGDTLSVGNEHKLKQIIIADRAFRYSYKDGFLEEVKDFPSIKLAKKQVLQTTRNEVVHYSEDAKVAVGPTGKNGSKSAGDYSGNRSRRGYNFKDFYTRKSKGRMVIEKQTSYFFIDKNNRFHPAKKSSILKIYVRNKNSIKSYLKEHNVNFDLEEDLIKLLEFSSQLGGT